MVGCSADATLEKLSHTEETKAALAAVTLLQAGNIPALVSRLPESLRTPETETALRRIHDEVIPAGTDHGHKLVGYRWVWANGQRRVALQIEYRFSKAYLFVDATFRGSPPDLQLIGMHVTQMATSLESQNAFRLGGRSVLHYAVLGAAVVVPLFIAAALILCIRTPMERKRKWLWALYILIGFGKLNLNWTTGQIWTETMAAQLFGASATTQSPYAPWIISVSLPVGAILFLVRRRRLTKRGPTETSPIPVETPLVP